MNNNKPTIRPKGYLYFFQTQYETGVIQNDYKPWEVEIYEREAIGDLMSGEEFYHSVNEGCIIDYDGTMSHVWADGYITNLGLCHGGLCQGGFLVDGDMWSDICRRYDIIVEWCNRWP